MTTSRLRAVAALTVAAFFAACGGSDGGPTYASTIDSASASAAADDAANFASGLASNMLNGELNTDIGSLLPTAGPRTANAVASRLIVYLRNQAYARAHTTAPAGTFAAAPNFASPFSTCTPSVTGINPDSSAIDTDDDGIPDDLHITFPANCVESDSAGTFTTTYTGSIRLQDIDGLYAFRLTVGNFKIKTVETATGNFDQLALNGFETATYASTGVDHGTDMTYAISFSGSAAAPPATSPSLTAPVTGSISFVYKETSSYDPDGTISLANPIPSGDLSFTFDYRILASSSEQPEQNFRFTMSTSTALHFDTATCHGINSGAVHGLLNGNSEVGFNITWTGCETYTITTFGTTEPTV